MSKLPKPAVTVFKTDRIKKLGTVKFRAMDFGEELAIAEAIALGDGGEFDDASAKVLDTLITVIDNCTFNKLDVASLESYIVDMLYIEIFSKTSGEMIPTKFTCYRDVETEGKTQKCGGEFGVSLPLSKVELLYPEGYRDNEIVMVNETGGFRLRQPSVSAYKHIRKDNGVSELTIDMVYAAIESFFDGETVTLASEIDKEEIVEYIKALPGDKSQQISEFLGMSPHLFLEMPYKCPKCGGEGSLEFKELNDFFAY